MPRSAILLFLLLASVAAADEVKTEFGGHTKLRLVGQSFPDDSLFKDLVGNECAGRHGGLATEPVKLKSGHWTFDSAYQLVGLQGDTLRLGGGLPNDDRRLFNLTDVLTEGGDSALLHRLDRLWVGYASEKTVVRFGRQALSWGNGLAYAPMDLVNPFNPTAIDTEYKTGDDMLYLQYLQDNGNDVQAAYVARRNPVTGDVESDQATAAVKYHGFAGLAEFDLLVADSYGDTTVGIGVGRACRRSRMECRPGRNRRELRYPCAVCYEPHVLVDLGWQKYERRRGVLLQRLRARQRPLRPGCHSGQPGPGVTPCARRAVHSRAPLPGGKCPGRDDTACGR